MESGGRILGFQVERVLREDPITKSVALLASNKDRERGVVVLSRRHFASDSFQGLLEGTALVQSFSNDVYAKYEGQPLPAHSAITIDTIFPATEKHISKHEEQGLVMVTETPELYRAVTLPYIESIKPERLQWVYNILEKKAEVERLLFEDPHPSVGFMLHPDLKWDQTEVEQLYVLAICHRRDVRSVRDLGADHLPFLENLRDKVLGAVEGKFKVGKEMVRAFVHYQPSYYHFHVHFVHVKVQGAGAVCGRAILLDDVIDNIKLDPQYYQRRTLTFQLGERDPLLPLFRHS